jgi:hypothetical protein
VHLLFYVLFGQVPHLVLILTVFIAGIFIYGELEIMKDPTIRTCVRPLLTTLESYCEEIEADEVEFFDGVNTCREGK